MRGETQGADYRDENRTGGAKTAEGGRNFATARAGEGEEESKEI